MAGKTEQAQAEAAAFQARLYRYWREHGLKGFFPIPWEEGCWSASILVKRALEEAGQAGVPEGNCTGIEFGGMWYVLGEALFAWDRRIAGEYYPYKCHGEHDHDHSFSAVLARAILEDGNVRPEERNRYYAHWMIRQLNAVRLSPELREKARPWARDPEGTAEMLAAYCPELAQPELCCFAGGALHRCGDIHGVYELAARYPDSFSLGEHAGLYSREQQACLDGILAYQKAAMAGEAP